MNRFLHNILTGLDNSTFDAGRVLLFSGGVTLIVSTVAFQAWALWQSQKFDPLEFCTGLGGGLGSLIAGGGLGIRQKDKGSIEVQQGQNV